MALIPFIPECTASTMSTWNFLFQWKIATPIKLCDPSWFVAKLYQFSQIFVSCAFHRIQQLPSLTLILGNYFTLLKLNTQNVFVPTCLLDCGSWILIFYMVRWRYSLKNFLNEYLNQCQFCGIRWKTNCSQSKIHFEYAKHWSTLQWF